MTRMDSDIPPPRDDEKPHKPADDKEEIYFQGSPLLRGEVGRLVLFALLGALCIAGPFLYRVIFDRPVPWWAYLIGLLLGLLLLLIPWFLIKSIRYRISNYRIDFERGILSRSIDTLELWHVEDISFHQSLLDRMLNVGTITIRSTDDSTPVLPLHGVPNPRPLFDSLKQRVIAVKRQRGVIKMDMG